MRSYLGIIPNSLKAIFDFFFFFKFLHLFDEREFEKSQDKRNPPNFKMEPKISFYCS